MITLRVWPFLIQKTPRQARTEGWDKVPGTVDSRFATGLTFTVPEIPDFRAFRDSGTFFQQFSQNLPDPRILAFFVFLAFFVSRFSLLFCAFLLSFPRISRVLQRGKSSLFSGDPRFLAKKARIGGSGL